jgi:plasmid stabilization system protein ParE
MLRFAGSLVWSREAYLVQRGSQELRAIHRFIARDSEFYAARAVARIIEKAGSIAVSPKKGHPIHEYPEAPLKEIHEPPYRVIYKLMGDEVNIVTIVHFKQRLRSSRLP